MSGHIRHPAHRQVLLVLFALALALPLAGARAAERAVRLMAADGVVVHGTFEGGGDPARPIALLFHQAGSNRGEYQTIAPRFAALGFDTLRIDQRSGGNAFGRRNETADGAGGRAEFLAALPDLRAALAWARAEGRRGPVVVVGSSYSASLVFLLAAEDPQIAAVIAFSPGEYFRDAGSVRRAAAKVRQPVFVSSASDAGEENEAATILAAVPATTKTQFRARNATHGASALAGSGAGPTWSALEAFLKKAVPRAAG